MQIEQELTKIRFCTYCQQDKPIRWNRAGKPAQCCFECLAAGVLKRSGNSMRACKRCRVRKSPSEFRPVHRDCQGIPTVCSSCLSFLERRRCNRCKEQLPFSDFNRYDAPGQWNHSKMKLFCRFCETAEKAKTKTCGACGKIWLWSEWPRRKAARQWNMKLVCCGPDGLKKLPGLKELYRKYRQSSDLRAGKVPRKINHRVSFISDEGARYFDWLFRQSVQEEIGQLRSHYEILYKTEIDAENAKKSRESYARNVIAQRERVARYKQAHPEKKSWWRDKRSEWATSTDDGTLTPETILRLFKEAKECVYCDKPFPTGGGGHVDYSPDRDYSRDMSAKSLDHVVPLSRGGAHSIYNVVICCWGCNCSKGKQLLEEWESFSMFQLRPQMEKAQSVLNG